MEETSGREVAGNIESDAKGGDGQALPLFPTPVVVQREIDRIPCLN